MSGRLVDPPGRQGPGAMHPRVVERIDLGLSRRATGVLPGEFLSLGAGVGLELAQLRAYQPGDDVRQLDAAATARTGEPHVRLHVPERALTTWLVVDVSPSMSFGSTGRLKSDVAEGVATVLGRLAIRRGGKLAAIIAGGEAERFLPPRGGRGALDGLRRALGAGVAADGTGSPDDIPAALDRVGRAARQRGLVVVVSDFRDVEGLRRPLGVLAQRHTVVAMEIGDPREAELPAMGHLRVVDPETGNQTVVDTSRRDLRERFATAERERRAALRHELQRARAEHLFLSTGDAWLRELARRMR